MHGRAGSVPCPLPPPPLAEVLGGGGGMEGRVLPGDSERGRGVLWQAKAASRSGGFFRRVNSAGFSRAYIWQVFTADFTAVFFRRVISAHLFGGFSWPVNQAGFKGKVKQNKRG
jgi:hypothetical protein